MRHARYIVGGCFLACTACDAPAPEPSAPMATTQQEATPGVSWPAAEELDGTVLSRLTADAQRVVARSPVPALVVDDAQLLETATVMAKAKWYAVSMRGDGVTVSIHATHHAHRYPHIEPQRPDGSTVVRGEAARVTANEAIWSVAWDEGGVAYSLEVECARLPDSRCEDEAYVMQLARRLAFVGGVGVKK